MYPATLRRFGAALTFAILLAAAPSASAAPPESGASGAEELRHEAKARFQAGAAAYQAGRFDEAIQLFQAADRLVPSPVLSFNVARSYDGLNESSRALAFYREYLRRAPSPGNGDAVRRRISEIESALTASGEPLLSVLSQPTGASVSIDGRPSGVTPLSLSVPAGAHHLVVTQPGYEIQAQDLTLVAARAAELIVRLQPSAAPASAAPRASSEHAAPVDAAARPSAARLRSRFYPWTWVTLGASGAAWLAAGGFELARRSAESDARAAKTQIAYEGHYNAMEGRQSTARVLAVIGGALSVTGGVLLLLDSGWATRSRATAAVACDARSCFAAVGGGF
jgi:tetratricopeptide (TPR) repeat protein